MPSQCVSFPPFTFHHIRLPSSASLVSKATVCGDLSNCPCAKCSKAICELIPKVFSILDP